MTKEIKKGFTLVEILVAVSVLLIGIVAIIQVFPISFSMETDTQLETQAVFLAQEKMEEIMSDSYEGVEIGDTSENLTAPFDRFVREVSVDYVDSSLNPTDSDTGLKMIEVTVTWESPFKSEDDNFKLKTLYSKN